MNKRGFTLIELLVVIVIIGLFSSLLMLSITPNQGRVLQQESKRFLHVVQLAQDEAILQGYEFGLKVEPDNYLFYVLQEERWMEVSGVPYMQVHTIKAPLAMRLELEDEQVIQKVEDEGVLPNILILSSGELSSFKLTFFNQDDLTQSIDIIGQENGQLTFEAQGG